MIPLITWLVLGASLVATGAPDHGLPAPVLAESLQWSRPQGIAGLETAWVLGEASAAAPYLLRVRLAAGARIPPHTHPDVRNTTVLAGTLHVGFGDGFDEHRLVAVPAGAVYVAPAGVPHYLWAKDGPVVYQEAGVGPTGNRFIPGADDAR